MDKQVETVILLAQQLKNSNRLSFSDICKAFDTFSRTVQDDQSRRVYKRILQESIDDPDFYLKYFGSSKQKHQLLLQSTPASPKSKYSLSNCKSYDSRNFFGYSQTKQRDVYKEIRRRIGELQQPRNLRRNLLKCFEEMEQTKLLIHSPSFNKLNKQQALINQQLIGITKAETRQKYKLMLMQKQTKIKQIAFKKILQNCARARHFKLRAEHRILSLAFKGIRHILGLKQIRNKLTDLVCRKYRLKVKDRVFSSLMINAKDQKNLNLRFPDYLKKSNAIKLQKIFRVWKEGIKIGVIVDSRIDLAMKRLKVHRFLNFIYKLSDNLSNKKRRKIKRSKVEKSFKQNCKRQFFYRFFLFLQRKINRDQTKMIARKVYRICLLKKTFKGLINLKIQLQKKQQMAKLFKHKYIIRIIFLLLKDKVLQKKQIIKKLLGIQFFNQIRQKQLENQKMQPISDQKMTKDCFTALIQQRNRQKKVSRSYEQHLSKRMFYKFRKTTNMLYVINCKHREVKEIVSQTMVINTISKVIQFSKYSQDKRFRKALIKSLLIQHFIQSMVKPRLKQIAVKRELDLKKSTVIFQISKIKVVYTLHKLRNYSISKSKKKKIIDANRQLYVRKILRNTFGALRGYVYYRTNLCNKLRLNLIRSIEPSDYSFTNQQQITVLIDRYFKETLQKKSLKALANNCQYSKHQKLLNLRMKQMFQYNLIKSVFKGWKVQICQRKQISRGIKLIQTATTGFLFENSFAKIFYYAKIAFSTKLFQKIIYQQACKQPFLKLVQNQKHKKQLQLKIINESFPYYAVKYSLRRFIKLSRLQMAGRIQNQQKFIFIIEQSTLKSTLSLLKLLRKIKCLGKCLIKLTKIIAFRHYRKVFIQYKSKLNCVLKLKNLMQIYRLKRLNIQIQRIGHCFSQIVKKQMDRAQKNDNNIIFTFKKIFTKRFNLHCQRIRAKQATEIKFSRLVVLRFFNNIIKNRKFKKAYETIMKIKNKNLIRGIFQKCLKLTKVAKVGQLYLSKKTKEAFFNLINQQKIKVQLFVSTVGKLLKNVKLELISFGFIRIQTKWRKIKAFIGLVQNILLRHKNYRKDFNLNIIRNKKVCVRKINQLKRIRCLRMKINFIKRIKSRTALIKLQKIHLASCNKLACKGFKLIQLAYVQKVLLKQKLKKIVAASIQKISQQRILQIKIGLQDFLQQYKQNKLAILLKQSRVFYAIRKIFASSQRERIQKRAKLFRSKKSQRSICQAFARIKALIKISKSITNINAVFNGVEKIYKASALNCIRGASISRMSITKISEQQSFQILQVPILEQTIKFNQNNTQSISPFKKLQQQQKKQEIVQYAQKKIEQLKINLQTVQQHQQSIRKQGCKEQQIDQGKDSESPDAGRCFVEFEDKQQSKNKLKPRISYHSPLLKSGQAKSKALSEQRVVRRVERSSGSKKSRDQRERDEQEFYQKQRKRRKEQDKQLLKSVLIGWRQVARQSMLVNFYMKEYSNLRLQPQTEAEQQQFERYRDQGW